MRKVLFWTMLFIVGIVSWAVLTSDDEPGCASSDDD